MAPQLTRLQAAFDDRRAKLRSAPAGLVPEEVIVLETVGPVEDFFKAVKRIGGMEWLGEYELEDIPPDDDFFALDSRGTRSPEKPLQGRLFMVFSGQTLSERCWPYGLCGEMGTSCLGGCDSGSGCSIT